MVSFVCAAQFESPILLIFNIPDSSFWILLPLLCVVNSTLYLLRLNHSGKTETLTFSRLPCRSTTMPGGRRLDHVTWNRRLGELQRFQQRHGHTIVPQDVPKLGVWVKLQRSRHRRGLLPHDRQQKLQNMGFDFQWRGTICNGTRKNNKSSTTTDSSSMKRKTSSWDRYFPVVKELVAEGGDLDKLKHSFKYKGLAIGVWKWKQQSMYNKCCRGGKAFSKQRFDLLTKLGFKDTSRGGEEDESSVALVGTMTPRQMPNRTGRSNNYAEHTNDEVTPAGECDDDDDDDESFKTPTSQGVRTYRKHNGETKSRYPIRSSK